MGTPREREGGMVKFGKSGDVDEADERMEVGNGDHMSEECLKR